MSFSEARCVCLIGRNQVLLDGGWRHCAIFDLCMAGLVWRYLL